MKYVVAGVLATAVVALLIYYVRPATKAPEFVYEVSEAKQKAVERETRVRPKSFEAMKWTPEAEVRTPASKQTSP